MKKLLTFVLKNIALFFLTMQSYGKKNIETRKQPISSSTCYDSYYVLRQNADNA